jgi:hypothetical protein
MIMGDSIKMGLPLRGAIGGGYFYKDGELMVSSGLVDAARYEKEQNWLGAVLTPKASQLVQKAKELEIRREGKTNIDFSSDRFNSFIKYGVIPWKDKNEQYIEKPHEAFYIKPGLADNQWASRYLPSYFDDQSKIENSHCLYAKE